MDAAGLGHSMLDALDRGDTASYAAHYTTDGVSHGPMYREPMKGRDAIAEGDLPPTGRPASIDLFVRLDRTPDGLVADSRGYYDVAALMTQLGLTP